MADELGAELSLDLDAARREVESFRRDLEDELERAVTTFGDAYEREVSRLPSIEPEIEAQAVTDELTRAVQSADTELSITGDVDALQAEINAVLSGPEPLAVSANTDPMVAQIEGLFESFHPEITPDLDTTALQRSLGELEGAATGLDIGAGFDDAALQGQELADVLDDISQQSEDTSDGLGSVSNVSTTLATAFSAARGDGRKLISDLSQIKGGFGGIAAGALALGAGFTALFEAGERSLASVERATVVLGDSAERLERIDVGGLSGELGELAVKAGVSGGQLRNAAVSASQVGLSSGKSAGEVTDFANKVNALALRAVALNPALGEAGAVAERLNLVLARGGRFLARYGLDLTSSEITMRALADTGKTAVRDLTLFERSVAGADIAVEKLGTNLGKDFERGAATATVRIASIRAELNSAFARAGRPLVEPTIEGFEALAEAGAGVSVALGKLGEAVLPAVSTSLTTLGKSAGVVTDVFGAIPGEVLAAAAAFVILDRSTSRIFGGGIRSVGDFRAAVSLAMETVAGRSVVALGALTALDQGLKAAGTSTEELGVQFITTGAAIGFSVAGWQGALVGAGIGAIAQVISAQDDLEKATEEVDESFRRAEASSGNLNAALFANADTAVGLASAIANLDINLAKFVRDASAFKVLHVDDDLHRLGLSVSEVADLAQQGEDGLARFIARAQEGGAITINLAKALSADLGPGLEDTYKRLNISAGALRNLAGENDIAAQAVIQLRHDIEELGLGTELTADEFVGLSGAEQKHVLAVLRAHGANTDLIVAFQTLQKQIRATERAQFDQFAATNKLSPAIVHAAQETARAADGTTDWAKALAVLGNAAVGIIPEFGRLTAQSALLRRELSGIIAATDAAAQSIPTFGSTFSQALEGAFFDASENITGKPLLDPEKLIGNTVNATIDFGVFFGNIERIAESGAGNVATALLQLGPSNLGARVAAELAANEPLFREGMEKALDGMSKAQLVSDSILGSLKARASLLANIQGTTFEELLQQEFGEVDISKLTNAQLVAFIQKYGDGGNAAAKELVDKFNTEIASRKIAGLDTQPLLDSVNEAKEKMPAAAAAVTDVYSASIDAGVPKVKTAAAKLSAPIPQSLQDIQPEVIAGISQVGDLLTTGSARATEDYEREFRVFQVTQTAMEKARGAISTAQTPITNAITGTVIGAIDDAGFSAGVAGFGLGVSIGQGIAQGLNGDAVARATQQAIDERIDAIDAYARASMGATSPAKRFYPHGEYIIEGMAVGAMRSDALNNAVGDKIQSISPISAGGGGGFGSTPTPATGVQPYVIQVRVDSAGQSIDSSIHDVVVHQYQAGADEGGRGLIRALRDYQFAR